MMLMEVVAEGVADALDNLVVGLEEEEAADGTLPPKPHPLNMESLPSPNLRGAVPDASPLAPSTVGVAVLSRADVTAVPLLSLAVFPRWDEPPCPLLEDEDPVVGCLEACLAK